MKRLALALLLALAPAAAWAQNAILQSGPPTKFDPLGYIGNPAAEAASKMFTDNFRGLNTAHHFDNKTIGDCWEDALTSGPYHEICIGHDSSGNALLTVLPVNGGSTAGFNINFNGTLFPFPFGTNPRQGLVTTTTFYVNQSTSTAPCGAFTCQPGNDGNNGLSNTQPFKTLQAAVNAMAYNYDFGSQVVNLQMADGTYSECVLLPDYIGSTNQGRVVSILGNAGNTSAVTVTCNSAPSATITAVNASKGWILKNIKVTHTANGTCVFADYHSAIYWDGGDFGVCGTHASAINTGAFLEFINHNYTIDGAAQIHASASDGGEIIWQTVTATITGTPAFSVGLFSSANGGTIDPQFLTISGAFTGAKYAVYGPTFAFSTGATASTTSSTQFIGQGSINTTENNYYVVAPHVTRIEQLYVNVVTAPGVGHTFTFTLRLGGNDTALTCTISDNATACNDLVHENTNVTSGVVIGVKMVSSASAATTQAAASVVYR